MTLVLLALAVALAAVWLANARAWMHVRRLPSLADIAPSVPAEGWPRLSIVVACKDEAGAVEQALSSLLAQDYPDLELVAVDDRSVDETGAILGRLARAHARLRVVHVDQLPASWLGKNHALARGAASCSGKWLLFTDADVLFAPDALRRAIAWASRTQLDHVVVVPEFIAPGFLERSFVSVFGLFFLIDRRVQDLRLAGTRGSIGIGAFNLVRAAAYRAIGGHERLKLEVADDVKLGLILRRSGFRQGCADSGGLVRVRWQTGFVASMRGLLKNFFAGLEFRWRPTLLAVFGLPLLTAGPPALAIAGPTTATRVVAAVATVTGMLLLGAGARRFARGNGLEGLSLPIVGPCLAGVALVSALLTTLRGAVVWRGTRYELRELRAGTVRDEDWPRERTIG